MPVIADIVFKADRLFADGIFDKGLHRAVVAVEQFFAGRNEHVVAKAVGHFDDAARGDAARGDQRVEIGLAPFRACASGASPAGSGLRYRRPVFQILTGGMRTPS